MRENIKPKEEIVALTIVNEAKTLGNGGAVISESLRVRPNYSPKEVNIILNCFNPFIDLIVHIVFRS